MPRPEKRIRFKTGNEGEGISPDVISIDPSTYHKYLDEDLVRAFSESSPLEGPDTAESTYGEPVFASPQFFHIETGEPVQPFSWNCGFAEAINQTNPKPDASGPVNGL